MLNEPLKLRRDSLKSMIDEHRKESAMLKDRVLVVDKAGGGSTDR